MISRKQSISEESNSCELFNSLQEFNQLKHLISNNVNMFCEEKDSQRFMELLIHFTNSKDAK